MKKSILILLHISYWAMYLFLVFMLSMVLRMNNPQATLHSMGWSFLYSPLSFGAIIPGIFGFYAGYLFIFKRYLRSKRIPQLFFSSIGLSLVFSALTQVIIYLAFNGNGVMWSVETCISMGTFLAFIAVVHSSTGMVMQGFIQWFEDIRLKADLNERHYQTEIALLKSQINPHFLFNTINNIDMLIAKDPSTASEYLNKLSDIMRFMLYETQTEKIPLSKELSYIEKFIDLQKIRSHNSDYIHYQVLGDASQLLVPPMLFIPFIENAFKHVSNKKTENAIQIRIEIDKGQIHFKCENNFNPTAKIQEAHSGLGLALIQKRLELMYPGKHTLNIHKKNDLYQVELSIH